MVGGWARLHLRELDHVDVKGIHLFFFQRHKGCKTEGLWRAAEVWPLVPGVESLKTDEGVA